MLKKNGQTLVGIELETSNWRLSLATMTYNLHLLEHRTQSFQGDSEIKMSASIFNFREFYFQSEKSKISDNSDDTDDLWPRTDFDANDASSPKTMSCVIFCVKQVLEKCVDWFLPIAEQTKNEAEVFFQQIESRLKRWLRIFKATKKCNRGSW